MRNVVFNDSLIFADKRRQTLAKSVGETIDHYLGLARKAGVDPGDTTAQQAKFLHISAGHLSQLRNAKVKLSNDVIDKIASAYVSKISSVDKEKLVQELVLSRDSTVIATTSTPREVDILLSAVGNFFEQVSNTNSLVCIVYGDLPQTNDDGPYPELADEAADAVANGCALAMFQPFGSVKQLKDAIKLSVEKDETLAGIDYLLKLAKEVRRIYTKIKDKAENIAKEQGRECQVVLYESNDLLPLSACSISSRLFYANYADDDGYRRYERVCQWVAGVGDKDYFIERDKESISVDAVALQFYPVPHHWTAHRRLPADNGQLMDALSDSKITKLARVGWPLKWEVYKDEEVRNDKPHRKR
jgi:hypothetical protein